MQLPHLLLYSEAAVQPGPATAAAAASASMAAAKMKTATQTQRLGVEMPLAWLQLQGMSKCAAWSCHSGSSRAAVAAELQLPWYTRPQWIATWKRWH